MIGMPQQQQQHQQQQQQQQQDIQSCFRVSHDASWWLLSFTAADAKKRTCMRQKLWDLWDPMGQGTSMAASYLSHPQ
jgi:hypothetical protein